MVDIAALLCDTMQYPSSPHGQLREATSCSVSDDVVDDKTWARLETYGGVS